jgi:hypothetical protein
MANPVDEHSEVIKAIIATNEKNFSILSNLGKDENYIAHMFPDLIFLDKATNKPVFIIEVKKNGNIAQCIQQWKTLSSIPATLYIVVPETDLANAKSIAEVVGLKTRFGAYTLNDNNSVSVRYE